MLGCHELEVTQAFHSSERWLSTLKIALPATEGGVQVRSQNVVVLSKFHRLYVG